MSHKTQFLIINGFDRSGTSLIAKVLAKNPQIECIFQPFSSTIVHRTQWTYWESDFHCEPVEAFMKSLLDGHLDRSFIASDWFKNHSTTLEVVLDQLHVIKSTKLHFKAEWFQTKFPQIPFYAIARDPKGILCSLLRNDFYQKWYGEKAYQAIVDHVLQDDRISTTLREQVIQAQADLEKMAAIVAVRTDVMYRSIVRDHVVVYEDVLRDPNNALNKIVSDFGLNEFDFHPYLQDDYNIIGKSFQTFDLWRDFFDKDEAQKIDAIFSTVLFDGKDND